MTQGGAIIITMNWFLRLVLLVVLFCIPGNQSVSLQGRSRCRVDDIKLKKDFDVKKCMENEVKETNEVKEKNEVKDKNKLIEKYEVKENNEVKDKNELVEKSEVIENNEDIVEEQDTPKHEKSCSLDDYPTQDNFDPDQFAGLWYEIERTRYASDNFWESGLSHFVHQRDNVMTFSYAGSRTGECSGPFTAFVRPVADNPADLNLYIGDKDLVGSLWSVYFKYKVIYTDYHVAITHACLVWNSDGTCRRPGELLDILSRTPHLDTRTRSHLYDIIRKHLCVDVHDLVESAHKESCHMTLGLEVPVDCSKKKQCNMFCNNGFVIGEDGCQVCKCVENEMHKESSGEESSQEAGGPSQDPIYKPGTGQIATWARKYPVVGQGILSFNTIRNSAFAIVVNQRDSKDWISLDVHNRLAFFTVFLDGVQTIVSQTSNPGAGYDKNLKVSYWFSYNRDQLVIKYGKGHVMDETTLLMFDFLAGVPANKRMDIRNQTETLFNPIYERFAEQYESDTPNKLKEEYKDIKKALDAMGKDSSIDGILSMESKVSFDKDPLVGNRPFVVMNSNDVTLFWLDRGNFTLSSSLPPTAKELYDNVRMTDLNYPVDVSNYLLSDAIRFSINSPGCILYEKLREKVGEFGSLAETYLRVTLGTSYGNSPGIPYVLEIWPSKHSSPIHNHGNSNAVIKVLFGTINVQIYNKFTPDINGNILILPPQLLNFNGFPGNFTWIDANWYQTHRLENLSDDFCATVQCYKYPDDDNIHWPYFDFISEQQQIREFIPESDFDFIPMRAIVLEEIQNGCDN